MYAVPAGTWTQCPINGPRVEVPAPGIAVEELLVVVMRHDQRGSVNEPYLGVKSARQ
jgi:hypothetical protein